MGYKKPRRSGKRSGGGGVNPANIVSTTSLVSQRETQRALVDQTLEVFSDFKDEYGTVVGDIEIATLKGRSGMQTMAYYDGDNIAINDRYFNNSRMEAAYKDCVDIGYHPSKGNKTAMQAVVAHELGHKLTSDVAVKMGRSAWNNDFDATARDICEQARKQSGHRGVVQMASKISGYAKQSNSEAIAEAVSDVYCNGSKARKESIAIVNVINSYLK